MQRVDLSSVRERNEHDELLGLSEEARERAGLATIGKVFPCAALAVTVAIPIVHLVKTIINRGEAVVARVDTFEGTVIYIRS